MNIQDVYTSRMDVYDTHIYVYFLPFCDQSNESSRKTEETLVHYNIDLKNFSKPEYLMFDSSSNINIP